MSVNGILIVEKYGTNAGYAINSLEKAFYEMATELVGSADNIHFAFSDLDNGYPASLPENRVQLFRFNGFTSDPDEIGRLVSYIKENDIDLIFGLDMPISLSWYRSARNAGAKHIVSYYGAGMTSLNSGLRLILKRIQVALSTNKPDHFIFESEAMRETAYRGRGVHYADTSVVHLGVDTQKYKPADQPAFYAHGQFDIPEKRRIVYYSGHMQERKGVAVIVRAATELVNERGREDLHFLFLGNKGNQADDFKPIYTGTLAEQHITFGGYRHDIAEILKSCYVGVIASTGWDSFTMSSIEIASSGCPLIVSRLQGLVETVVDGETGFLFTPGSHSELASRLALLADDPELAASMGQRARQRVVAEFSLEHQKQHLLRVVKAVIAKT